MRKPENIKEYKGYKGTWAVNVKLFDQNNAQNVSNPKRSIPIQTIGTDRVNDDEKKVVKTVVNQFNKATRESKNIKPLRTMHIRKP